MKEMWELVMHTSQVYKCPGSRKPCPEGPEAGCDGCVAGRAARPGGWALTGAVEVDPGRKQKPHVALLLC